MPSLRQHNPVSTTAEPTEEMTHARTVYNAAQTFDFLGLPTELRLEVYEYLLKPTELHVLSEEHPEFADSPEPSGLPLYLTKREKGLHIAIIKTCKQIYAEARPILCSPQVLYLHPLALQTGHAEKALTTDEVARVSKARFGEQYYVFDPAWLGKMAKLTSLNLRFVFRGQSVAREALHPALLAKCFTKNMDKLKEITIDFEFGHLYPGSTTDRVHDDFGCNINSHIAILQEWKNALGVIKADRMEIGYTTTADMFICRKDVKVDWVDKMEIIYGDFPCKSRCPRECACTTHG